MIRRRGSRAVIAPLCFMALCSVAIASDFELPRRLTDGSTPPMVPQPLASEGRRFVMTRTRVVEARQLKRLVVACARQERVPARTRVVERVGVSGRSITFRGPYGTIRGCDRSLRARPIQAPFCGGAAWNIRHGTVSDPRLDLCYDRRSRPVIAFAWINPVPHARWIVVDQPGYREIYPVAGGLPVRLSTISDLEHSGGALFRTAQYDVRGVLLVRRKVVAAIAS